MHELVWLKMLHKFRTGVVAVLEERSPSKSNAGFTLIELVVVVIMIGILSAIVAPSWTSFVNQQRVRAANEAVLSALQQAQREAKRTKLSYSVSFKTEDTPQGKVSQVAIHRTDTTPTNWENLGKDLQLKPGQVLLGTNLTGENTAGAALSYGLNSEQKITFDYSGTLPPPPATNLGSKGLIVTVAVPESSNSTQVLDRKHLRCVIVQTLLGSMRTAKGNECNNS